MSKRSYHFGPMDPSSDCVDDPGPSKRKALNMLETLRQDFRRDTGELRRGGDGFLYEIGDQTFYSPNCNRPDVRVPPKLHASTSPSVDTSRVATSSSGVLLGRDFDVEEFMQPQWWTGTQGYFAFTPRVLDVTTPSFRHLRHKPLVHRTEQGSDFYVDRLMLGAWKNIEDDIISSLRKLRSFVALSMVLPLPPCAQIDGATFKSKRQAMTKVERAQGWFKVWAGALGYAIAVFDAVSSKAKAVRLQTEVPAWVDVLLNAEGALQPLDDVFVSDVSRVVAQYDGSIARVGAFIELPDTPNEEMVSIDWLLSINVPVWWVWGPREERIAKEHPVFNRYRPPSTARRVFGGPVPVHVDLPMNVDSPPNEPSHPEDPSANVDPLPDEPSHPNMNSANDGPPRFRFERRPIPTDTQLDVWNKARKMRNDHRDKRIAKETDQQRQRRVAVEQNPPTRANKVLYWVWSLDPELNVYSPEVVDRDEAQQMFSSESDYSRQQAEYDYYARHWHVADFLGVPDDGQLTRMADEAAEYYATPYDLELLRLRVWYGLADVPLETPSQMKARMNAESRSVGGEDEAVGTPLQAKDHINTERVSVERDDNAVAGDAGAEDLTHTPAQFNDGEGVQERANLDARGGSDVQEDAVAFDPHHARTETTSYLLCGYVAPDPLPRDDGDPNRPGGAVVARLIGQVKSLPLSDDYWSTLSGKSLARFGSVIKRGSPSNDADSRLWDLSPSSRNPVVERPRFSILRCIRGARSTTLSKWDNMRGSVSTTATVETRVVWFDALSDRGWFLGTTSPAVALHICRLDDALGPTDIAYDLLSRGFRIQTFNRLPASWRSPIEYHPPSSSSSLLARYRRCGHKWTRRDYDSWIASVKIFMRTSRGRAAILRGGVVWRITVQLLLPELALLGPSHKAMRGEGFVIEDESGSIFVDDELTDDEVDLICGVHYVYIASEPKKNREPVRDNRPDSRFWERAAQEQMQRVSFFPPEDLWLTRFGTAAGWSEDADYWHRQLEDQIRNGVFEPKTRKQWREVLRPHPIDLLDKPSTIAIDRALGHAPTSTGFTS